MTAKTLCGTLANLRWLRNETPFPHFLACNVLATPVYAQMEAAFCRVLARGEGAPTDPTRFSRNMPNSDAQAWNMPPDIDGPLSLFYDRSWHDMLAEVTGVSATGDVNGALHHHPPHTVNGFVHSDLGVGWFSYQPRPDGINPMDLARCTYTSGNGLPGIARHEAVRAVTMIFYLANPTWRHGDGGETGLYQNAIDPVDKPCTAVPPLNNSILVFENTPKSYHSFLQNKRTARSSIILWLHRSVADTEKLWGEASIGRWD